MKNLVVFASGAGTNFKAILDACNNRIIPAQVKALVFNREAAGCAAIAKEHDVPIHYAPWDNTTQRERYDSKLGAVVNEINPDLIVLAGWMHVFTKNFLNYVNAPVINLHPALPGQFPGKDAIGDAWTSFCANKITETGVMTHYVVEEVDAGAVLSQVTVPILRTDSKNSLTARVKNVEKGCLINGICRALNDIGDHPELDAVYEGKVRSLYDIDNNFLLLSCSDRLSAFDKFRCHVNNKGVLLTETAAWWFQKTRAIIDNHYLWHSGNNTIVRRVDPIKVEVIVRRHLTGSLWKAYNSGNRKSVLSSLPEGLTEHARFDTLLVTPTTKAPPGEADEDLDEKMIPLRGLCSLDHWKFIRSKALELFEFAEAICSARGITLVDTKFEFGIDRLTNKVILIDEIFTPDSSRFWYNGDPTQNLDKDIIRRWIKEHGYENNTSEQVKIPAELITQTQKVYLTFYEKLTGEHANFLKLGGDRHRTIKRFYEFFVPRQAVIIAGSTKDSKWCDKLKTALGKFSIPVKNYYASAHKEPAKVLEVLRKTKSQTVVGGTRIVLITVAGRSNALSGFTAANSDFPVIACPPFADKSDQMVNINSTLQMPSNVPVATVLDPGNAAELCSRILYQ